MNVRGPAPHPPTSPRPAPDRGRLPALGPRHARVLSVVALCAMWLWFTLKLVWPTLWPVAAPLWAELAVGASALLGFASALVLFTCTYGFVANAPDRQLDEREMQERNAAYLRAYQYAVLLLLVGYIGSDVADRFMPTPEAARVIVTHFLNVAFLSCLIMPATILAWRDPSDGSTD